MWWLILLLACRTDDDGVGPSADLQQHSDTATSTTVVTPDPVRAAVEEAGFTVGEGALVFSTMEGCCSPGANCWGNNPSTPYGAYAVPPAPGEAPRPDTLLADFGPVPPGLSRDFLLRPDEALVWLGTMPPEALYFGFRSYLGLRPSYDHPVIGSLGAQLNHQVVALGLGEAPWGQPIAVITTADPAIEERVQQALLAGGWEASHIFTDPIAPVVTLGLDEATDDSLFTVMRVAVYDDKEAGAAWEADPGVVWRLTPDVVSSGGSHPIPSLPSRGAGTNEDAWADALAQLESAVLAVHDGPRSIQESVVPYWRDTLDCIDDGFSCTGDSRDRYVGISPYFQLPRSESYLVAFGVNHQRTGKASYSSVAIQTIEAQRGIEAVDSVQMVGSARSYLDHPLVDDLYVVVFARDCEGHNAPCVTVPWVCPGGGPAEVMKITARAYLEPATGAAPIPEELQRERLILVLPDGSP